MTLTNLVQDPTLYGHGLVTAFNTIAAFRKTPYTYDYNPATTTVTYLPSLVIAGIPILYSVHTQNAKIATLDSRVRWIQEPLIYAIEFAIYRIAGSILTAAAAATLLPGAVAIKAGHAAYRSLQRQDAVSAPS